jgi:uncharacterized protein YoxC
MTDNGNDILWVAMKEPLRFRRGSRPDPLHEGSDEPLVRHVEVELEVLIERAQDRRWRAVLERVADTVHSMTVQLQEIPSLRHAVDLLDQDNAILNDKVDELEGLRDVMRNVRLVRDLKNEQDKVKELRERIKELKEGNEQQQEDDADRESYERGDHYEFLLLRHRTRLREFSEDLHAEIHDGPYVACTMSICKRTQKWEADWWASASEVLLLGFEDGPWGSDPNLRH